MAPKVKCISTQRSYECLIYSDDHQPPHLHIMDNSREWEIRVYFLNCEKGFLDYEFKIPSFRDKNKAPLPRKIRNQILEDILDKKEQLYVE